MTTSSFMGKPWWRRLIVVAEAGLGLWKQPM